jgi:hypothetical protein
MGHAPPTQLDRLLTLQSYSTMLIRSVILALSIFSLASPMSIVASKSAPQAATPTPTPTMMPVSPAFAASDSVPYASGRQMVSGPSGTVFPVGNLYRDESGAYVRSLTNSVSRACEGYWADFPAPTLVVMDINAAADSQGGSSNECPLRTGWNFIGNPFALPAAFPTGTLAFLWTGQQYVLVRRIEMGTSVWIYSRTPGSIPLTSL